MLYVIPIILSSLVSAKGDDAPKQETYKLTAVRISNHRGQNLELKLSPLDPKGKEVVLRFPAHSFTPHERKLSQYARDAVTFEKGKDPHEWTPVNKKVKLTLPTGFADKQHLSYKILEEVQIVSDDK